MQNTGPCVQPSTSSANSLAALVHLSGIFTLFIGPLVIYRRRRDEPHGIRDAAREALNFLITLMLAWIVTIMSLVVLIGFLMLPILALISIALPIWAAASTAKGEDFRYPLIPRLLR